MKLFMFENEEHSATKEINALNNVLEELNENLYKENNKLSILKDKYDGIAPMQFEYAIGTAEYNYCMNKIANAQTQYYQQYYKTQRIQHQISEVQHEIGLLQ